MAFEAITTTEIQVKKPVTRSLWSKVKNSLDFLNGRIGTLALLGVPNGSFEIDSDADGVPDNWTRSLYAGGTGGIVTDLPDDGANGFGLVHPGGAGNGGGYLESDYIVCSQLRKLLLGFIHWSTAAGMHNLVQIRYFTKAKVYISDATLYDSTANPTSPVYFIAPFTPPATARYYKVRLIGGYTDTNVAGTAYFDAIGEAGVDILMTRTSAAAIAETESLSSTNWEDVASVAVQIPFIGVPVNLAFTADIKETSNTLGHMRFRVGTTYSGEVDAQNADWATHSFSITGVSTTTGSLTLYLQLKHDAGGLGLFGRKASATTLKVTPEVL